MPEEKRKGKFCPRCGKLAEKFYNGLDKNCFLETTSLMEKLPERLVLRSCKNCGKIYVDDDFAVTIEGALDILLRELLERKDMQLLHSASYRIEGRKVHMTIVLKLEDVEKIEKKDAELVIKSILCENCSMKKSGYYNSIVQLRVPKELIETFFDEVQQQVDFLSHYDNMAFISKIEKRKEGLDLYFGSKNVAMQIARNLKDKFRAAIKITRKNAGLKQGQKVYRDTILVRLEEKKGKD